MAYSDVHDGFFCLLCKTFRLLSTTLSPPLQVFFVCFFTHSSSVCQSCHVHVSLRGTCKYPRLRSITGMIVRDLLTANCFVHDFLKDPPCLGPLPVSTISLRPHCPGSFHSRYAKHSTKRRRLHPRLPSSHHPRRTFNRHILQTPLRRQTLRSLQSAWDRQIATWAQIPHSHSLVRHNSATEHRW